MCTGKYNLTTKKHCRRKNNIFEPCLSRMRVESRTVRLKKYNITCMAAMFDSCKNMLVPETIVL